MLQYIEHRINMIFYSIKFLMILLLSASLVWAEILKTELHKLTSAQHASISYTDAKKKLFNEIYLQQDAKGSFVKDVYCLDNHYLLNGDIQNDRLPDPSVLNTEHTWPQSKFTNFHSSSIQKSDLHHLFPTASKINSERGNLPFAEVDRGQELFCDEPRLGSATSGEHGDFFEPPDQHKGNVARSMFYFSIRYNISIDPAQENYLRLWHRDDPVDEAEKLAHEKIFKIQKNRNPFIDSPQLVSQIQDF